jgi:hypothetical protein
VFVAATPDVWYWKDADGDGRAEVRRKVCTGFKKLNVQAVVNNLTWGARQPNPWRGLEQWRTNPARGSRR